MRVLSSSLILFAVLYVSPSFAQSTFQPGAIRPGLRQGSWAVGGGLGIGYSSVSGLLLHATPRAQYFIYDKFSVGGQAEYYKSEDYQRLGIGPAATYYFLETASFVTFVSQTFILSQTRPDEHNPTTFYGITGLGLNYFLSSGLALALSYNQHYPLDDGQIEGPSSVLQTGIMLYF